MINRHPFNLRDEQYEWGIAEFVPQGFESPLRFGRSVRKNTSL